VCLAAGDDKTVTVTYEPDPASGKLWLAEFDNWQAAVAFDPDDLVNRRRTDPWFGWSVSPDENVRALAFDGAGDLWLASAQSIVAYDRRDLGVPRAGKPKIHLTGPALARIRSIGFDRQGALWIVREGAAAIAKLAPAALTASGQADLALTVGGADVHEAQALAFDREGNLWIGRFSSLAMFRASRLTTSLEGPADVRLDGVGPVLAFDREGSLWARAPGGLARFRPAEARAGGPPGLTLLLPDTIHALTFDESGGAWFQPGAGRLAHLAREQLQTSGRQQPAIVHDRSYLETDSLTFFPPPGFLDQ
jgi:ligand-binding sensor domain-containing protein